MKEVMDDVIAACIIACMIVSLCAFMYSFGAWIGKKINGNRLPGYQPVSGDTPPDKLPTTGSSCFIWERDATMLVRCKNCLEYYEYDDWDRSRGESYKDHSCHILNRNLGPNGFCSLGNPRAVPPPSEEN